VFCSRTEEAIGAEYEIIKERCSMATASFTETIEIYVPLLNEGTDVLRPTKGIREENGEIRVLATIDYDPSFEEWAFPPGSKVKCVLESRGDSGVLIARQLVA